MLVSIKKIGKPFLRYGIFGRHFKVCLSMIPSLQVQSSFKHEMQASFLHDLHIPFEHLLLQNSSNPSGQSQFINSLPLSTHEKHY